jgi:hypothetical protein
VAGLRRAEVQRCQHQSCVCVHSDCAIRFRVQVRVCVRVYVRTRVCVRESCYFSVGAGLSRERRAILSEFLNVQVYQYRVSIFFAQTDGIYVCVPYFGIQVRRTTVTSKAITRSSWRLFPNE